MLWHRRIFKSKNFFIPNWFVNKQNINSLYLRLHATDVLFQSLSLSLSLSFPELSSARFVRHRLRTPPYCTNIKTFTNPNRRNLPAIFAKDHFAENLISTIICCATHSYGNIIVITVLEHFLRVGDSEIISDYIQMNGNLSAAFVRCPFSIARPQRYTVESIKSMMLLNVIHVRLRSKILETLGCISRCVEKQRQTILDIATLMTSPVIFFLVLWILFSLLNKITF